MTEWIYKDIPFDEALIPENALGFIYQITRLTDGKIYIGKKLLFFKKTSYKVMYRKLKRGQTGKGEKYKKKIIAQTPSDWRTYWSSSENLVKNIQELGEDKFRREILFFCSSKGGLGYHEAQLQMELRVLENTDKYFNGIVSCRIHWKHVTQKIY